MANHWLDKSEYPFTSNYFDINGQKLHYIDEGKGETVCLFTERLRGVLIIAMSSKN